MDLLGLSLSSAVERLTREGMQYTIEYTVPTRDYFKVDEKILFVVRQRRTEDGVYLLTAAKKMRKEVY